MQFAQAIERVVYSATMEMSSPQRYHALPILLPGLILAHVVGSLQVYASNLRLFNTVTALSESGYVTVPNRLVAPLLESIATALKGGVFFTLSIGAGAALLAFVLTWAWKTLGRRRPALVMLPVLPLAFLVALANLNGLSPFATLYLTLVPAAVAALTMRYTPTRLSRGQWLRAGLHGLVVLMLAAVWATQAGNGMFITIRDRLLLSTPAGIAVNDFYYRYTLYPAEAFKSLHQKMLKTCRLDGFTDLALERTMLRRLADHNYLAVPTAKTASDAGVSNTFKPPSAAVSRVDLVMTAEGDNLQFHNGGSTVVEVSQREFIEDAGSVLKTFSEKSDRHRHFRQMTFYALLVGFPLILYTCLHFILARVTALFVRPETAATAAALLCLLLGILAVIPLRSGHGHTVPADRVPDLLQSDKWQDNADALKALALQEKNWRFAPEDRRFLQDPHIPVRYWLARSLAGAGGPLARPTLLDLMEDPQPIVVCQAIYSLGRRRDARAVPAILDKINRSDHWYVQWYGYNALKGLGWRQKPSI